MVFELSVIEVMYQREKIALPSRLAICICKQTLAVQCRRGVELHFGM